MEKDSVKVGKIIKASGIRTKIASYFPGGIGNYRSFPATTVGAPFTVSFYAKPLSLD